jgi:hypothetical protein
VPPAGVVPRPAPLLRPVTVGVSAAVVAGGGADARDADGAGGWELRLFSAPQAALLIADEGPATFEEDGGIEDGGVEDGAFGSDDGGIEDTAGPFTSARFAATAVSLGATADAAAVTGEADATADVALACGWESGPGAFLSAVAANESSLPTTGTEVVGTTSSAATVLAATSVLPLTPTV